MFCSSSGNMLIREGVGIKLDERGSKIIKNRRRDKTRHTKSPHEVAEGNRRSRSRQPEVLNSPAHIRRVQLARQCPPTRRSEVARIVGELIPASNIQPTYQPEIAISLGELVRQVPKPLHQPAVVTTEARLHSLHNLEEKHIYTVRIYAQ